MKLLGLVFSLLVCIAICSAQDAPKAKSSRRQSDFQSAQVAGGAEDRLLLNMNMKPDSPDSLDNANAATCAYMRTYRVKRQVRGSDTVAPAGYTSCVPMRHFEMRSTVETRTGSGDK